jgi:hypothetical protein
VPIRSINAYRTHLSVSSGIACLSALSAVSADCSRPATCLPGPSATSAVAGRQAGYLPVGSAASADHGRQRESQDYGQR